MRKPATPEFVPAMQLALVANTRNGADPWLSVPARATGWVPVFVSNCPPARRMEAVKQALRAEGFWVEECSSPRFS